MMLSRSIVLQQRHVIRQQRSLRRTIHCHVVNASSSAGNKRKIVGTLVGCTSIVGMGIALSTNSTGIVALEEAPLLDRLQQMFFSSKKDDAEEERKSATPSTGEEEKKRVTVELEEELVAELPEMSWEEVQKCDGINEDGRMMVVYDGIVYDVTEFADAHPGGKEMLRTAAGNDLEHFFENYTVHSQTDKAGQWLAPLAVGKISPEQTVTKTTAQAHVHKRHVLLNKARKQILWIASSLPFWIGVRSLVSLVGWFMPSVARRIANTLPVSIPGYTQGTQPLEKGSVAVIGGGIAGCGAAWALSQSGFDVTLLEARTQISGNARTFDWTNPDGTHFVKSCVSVTAWPPNLYKNYTALLQHFKVETVHQPLSWFLNSKVPGFEGHLWGADPRMHDGSLRKVFEKDFRIYKWLNVMVDHTTEAMKLKWMLPWKWNDSESMYDNHTGLGMLNPFNVVPLYSIFRMMGGSKDWWDVIFTPYYTASFLVDELRPFPAVFGPLIEAQIPLHPNKQNSWQGSSKRSSEDCNITTCVTWKDAGKGIRQVFDLLTKDIHLKQSTRVTQIEILDNGKKRVYDEYDNYVDVDRVVFACPVNAIGNILRKNNSKMANTIFNTPVYADDHHPSSGHMHAVMHSDPKMIEEPFREECLKRASNYVEVTQNDDKSINIENQYNFGVQTPGPGVYDMDLKDKPVMLISHSPGKGKEIDPQLVRGTGNHARAHPLYSGWNVAAQLSLRLVQGQNGIYYCANWTTPGNCHDMSLLSGFVCAHAIGAKYPFEQDKEAKKDFTRLRDWMGI